MVPPQGTVKYVSPKAVADLRLSWLEGYMNYQPVLYSKVTAFRQEWKVCVGGGRGQGMCTMYGCQSNKRRGGVAAA